MVQLEVAGYGMGLHSIFRLKPDLNVHTHVTAPRFSHHLAVLCPSKLQSRPKQRTAPNPGAMLVKGNPPLRLYLLLRCCCVRARRGAGGPDLNRVGRPALTQDWSVWTLSCTSGARSIVRWTANVW